MYWMQPYVMRHGLRKEIDREPRRKAKVGRRGLRQLSSGGSRALSSASIVGKEQSNQLKAVAQTSTPSGRSGSTFYQGCGYHHYRQYTRLGTCFRCCQPSNIKRDCPQGSSRAESSMIAPPPVIAPAVTEGTVTQTAGKGTTGRGAHSGGRG